MWKRPVPFSIKKIYELGTKGVGSDLVVKSPLIKRGREPFPWGEREVQIHS